MDVVRETKDRLVVIAEYEEEERLLGLVEQKIREFLPDITAGGNVAAGMSGGPDDWGPPKNPEEPS